MNRPSPSGIYSCLAPVRWLYTWLFCALLSLTCLSKPRAQVRYSELFGAGGTLSMQQAKHLDSVVFLINRDAVHNPDSAIKALETVYEECRSAGYSYGMANALLSAASVIINVKNESDATPAVWYCRRALPYLEGAKARDRGIYARWCTTMGSAQGRLARMDSAMHYFAQALDFALKTNAVKDVDMVRNYINLQVVCFEMQQFDRVISYAQQSVKIAAELGLHKEVYRSYKIMAAAYLESGQPDSTLYYLSGLDTIPYTPDGYDIKLTNELLGTVYLHKGNYRQAASYFKKSIAVNSTPSPTSLRGLGKSYMATKQYLLAERYLLDALQAVQESKMSRQFLVGAHRDLAALYDSMGNYKEAYLHRSQETLVQKDIDDKNKVEVVNRLESSFHRAAQDKQLSENKVQLLAAKNRLDRKNLWIGGIALCALLLGMVAVAFYQKQKLQSQRVRTQEQHIEIEKLRAAIEAEEKERSRIGRQLHDDIMVQLSIVKMNLEALPAQCAGIDQVGDFHSVKELLNIAGRDLRQTAHNLAPDTLLADGLTQALLYFFKNVQYRTRLAINFQYYGDAPELSQETEINIYRIAQELVQNIIKHAQAKNVLVQLSYRPDMLTLTIEDDGVGFDRNGMPHKAGIGLKSIYSRLKVMNGEMDIHPRRPQGTSVTIEVYFNAA